MSEYQLHHGDCLDVLPTLAPQSVDAVIADIPSGRTACAWDSVIPFEPMWEQLRRVTKPRGAIVLLGCTQPFTSALIMSNVKMFRYALVWEKSKQTGFLDVNRKPLASHEDIVLFSDGQTTYNPQKWRVDPRFIDRRKTFNDPINTATTYNTHHKKRTYRDDGTRYPRSVLKFASEAGLHDTQKPLALLEYLIRTYTNAGDTVLDFTMGSGTCGAACGNLGRRFIGIEKDKAYYDLGAERIATAYAPLRMMEAAV